jgi:hypothetical protein
LCQSCVCTCWCQLFVVALPLQLPPWHVSKLMVGTLEEQWVYLRAVGG